MRLSKSALRKALLAALGLGLILWGYVLATRGRPPSEPLPPGRAAGMIRFSADGPGLDPNASLAVHTAEGRLERLPYGRSVLAMSRDGRWAVALDPASPDDKVPLLVLEQSQVARVKRPEKIREWGRDRILIHPDGVLAWYTGGYDTWKPGLAEYDCRTQKWTVSEAPMLGEALMLGEVTSLVFGATPDEFYGARADGAIISWRVGEIPQVVGQGTYPDYCAAGGLAYLALDRRSLVVWPPGATGQRILRGPGAEMFHIAWSPDGRFLAYDYQAPHNYWLCAFGLGICTLPGWDIGAVEVATGRNFAVVPSPQITDLGPALHARSPQQPAGGGAAPRLERSGGELPLAWVAELDPGVRQTLVRLEGRVPAWQRELE